MQTIAAVFLIVVAVFPCGAQVRESFFGMEVNKLGSREFTVPISSLRLWDTGTNWFQLCPAPSRCNWERLDRWLALAKSNGISEVMYTIGKTPQWASANPDGICPGRQHLTGACFPPRDIALDGSGSDDSFKQFIQAVVRHNQQLNRDRFAKIKFWGIWNEPDTKIFWQGSVLQLVRMTRDARTIIKSADPSALILTPEASSTTRHVTAGDWLDKYFSAGGDRFVDVVAFHAAAIAETPGVPPSPEDVVRLVKDIQSKLGQRWDASTKPYWMTEGDWGRTNETGWDDYNQAAYYVVRYYTLLASLGIQRVYWYMYDGDPHGCCGAMWTRDTGDLPTAKAYREMHRWLLGRTVSPCSARAHIWACDLTSSGYAGRIVWDDEYGHTASYDPTGFDTEHDVFGHETPLTARTRTITVGNGPVLLEKSGQLDH